MSKGRKIISQGFGGLGDHLLLSTLPRRFAEQGYEVFMHHGPMTQYRNSEIKALIMANPHFSKENGGFSDEPPNAGLGNYWDIWGKFCWEARLRKSDPIALMEEVNGLPPPYSHLPEIYCDTPTGIQMRDDLILVDPFSSSLPFGQDSVGPWLEFYGVHYGVPTPSHPPMVLPPRSYMAVVTPGYAAMHRAGFGLPSVTLTPGNSLSEYIALLFSVHAFFGVESGGQMLAAAVKNRRPELKVHALFSTRGMNQKFFRMPEDYVLTDVSGFVIQNDFAVDPGMLGYLHLTQTARFAAHTQGLEKAEVPAPIVNTADLLSMRQPGEIIEYIPPDPLDNGFPTQKVHMK